MKMDNEPNLFLRRLREMLGYGLGWTFWGALWDWSFPILWLLVSVGSLIYLSLHIEIVVRFK